MSSVGLGDEIAIHFRLEDSEGNLVAKSKDGQPLSMRVGSQDVIMGINIGIIGMHLDDVRTLPLKPEYAFGADHESVERIVDKGDLPEEIVVGDQLRLRYGDSSVTLWVAEDLVAAWRVTTKHPLCGQNVALTVKVVAHRG